MQCPETLLESHPLLRGLSAEQMRRLSELGEAEIFEVGESIVTGGTLGDSMYLLLSGRASVVAGDRPLATLGAGEFFGEMSLVEPVVRSASVIADERTCTLRLPHLGLQQLLTDDRDMMNVILLRLTKVLSERLRKSNEVLASVGHLADWLGGSLV